MRLFSILERSLAQASCSRLEAKYVLQTGESTTSKTEGYMFRHGQERMLYLLKEKKKVISAVYGKEGTDKQTLSVVSSMENVMNFETYPDILL